MGMHAIDGVQRLTVLRPPVSRLEVEVTSGAARDGHACGGWEDGEELGGDRVGETEAKDHKGAEGVPGMKGGGEGGGEDEDAYLLLYLLYSHGVGGVGDVRGGVWPAVDPLLGVLLLVWQQRKEGEGDHRACVPGCGWR